MTGFGWDSCEKGGWYTLLKDLVPDIKVRLPVESSSILSVHHYFAATLRGGRPPASLLLLLLLRLLQVAVMLGCLGQLAA